MKAITHNILMCNIKKCEESKKNFPFIIIANKVENKSSKFDINLTKKIYESLDKEALNEFCKDLNIVKYDFTKVDDNIKNQNEFWEYVHKVIDETLVVEGNLKCPNCQREFPIINGIVDMVLRDDEM